MSYWTSLSTAEKIPKLRGWIVDVVADLARPDLSERTRHALSKQLEEMRRELRTIGEGTP